MNTLFNHIPSDSFSLTYENVKNLIRGNEQLIFNAMATITHGSPNQFVSTNDPSQYQSKYREMERRFRFRSTLAGVEMGLNMMAKVYEEILSQGNIGQIQPNDLLNELIFETNREFKIRLNNKICWAIVWNVRLDTPKVNDAFDIVLDIHKREWGQIAPVYIVEYLDSAVNAYSRGMYTAALALLSIVIEATLRDLLSTRGYTFQEGASSIDVFDWVQANVDVDITNNHYTVSIPPSVPKSPSDFQASAQANTPLPVQIRRKVRANGFDLLVRSDSLVDHWSPNTVNQPAQQTISGLGAALDIARNREQIITEEDLTLDFDSVIKAVRNNLIHLSGDALNTHLPDYDNLTPGRNYTLRDFLNSPEMVFDLVTNVPQFVNEQYYKLRQQGHVI